MSTIAALAEALSAAGFVVRSWQGKRLYVDGYGRDITAWLEPAETGTCAADGASIIVRSSWRSRHVFQRCKGVKHAILSDLHAAGLLSVAPPDDWRRVALDDPPRVRR